MHALCVSHVVLCIPSCGSRDRIWAELREVLGWWGLWSGGWFAANPGGEEGQVRSLEVRKSANPSPFNLVKALGAIR